VLYDAALRNLQTLSEATQLLPEDKKAACPGIPWREIAGFRNILVHSYLGNIDPLTVKSDVEKHLQPLEECIGHTARAGRLKADRTAPSRPNWIATLNRFGHHVCPLSLWERGERGVRG
jgi:hypothetical protein